MSTDIERIHSFWFDRPNQPMCWFIPEPKFDQEIKDDFGDLINQARNTDKLDDWQTTPRGALSLILLIDQFSRNVFRGTPESFSADSKGYEIATRAIAKGFTKHLSLIERAFVILPLVHREELGSQIAAISLAKLNHAECEEGTAAHQMWGQSDKFWGSHLECILRFGRFPSRNQILGRTNTVEEDEWMQNHPDGF